MTTADTAPSGQTDPTASAGSPAPATKILGRPERLLRTQLFRDHTDGALGFRTGQMTTGPWVLDLDGRPTGAAAAILLDNTLATSLRAAEPEVHWMVTTELELHLLRSLPDDGTVLDAWTRSRVADVGGGLSTGTLVGPDGTEYVHASGWFQSVPASPAAAVRDFQKASELPLGPETEAPLGALMSLEEDSVAAASGDRPAVDDTFRDGLRFTDSPELRNPHGAVHGGVQAIMASLAAQNAMPDRTSYDLQSLRVTYLRPASGALTARTRVRHAGRSLRVVEVDLVGEAGKPFIHTESVFRTAR